MWYISIFQQSIHHANILAVFVYPSINLFLYSHICIYITSKVFEMFHLFDFNVMQCYRNLWWGSVDDHYFSFHKIEFELVLDEAVFQVVIHFSSSSFVVAVCAMASTCASINGSSLSFIPWTSFITRSMYNIKSRGESILPCHTPDLVSNQFPPPIWVFTLLLHTLYVLSIALFRSIGIS